MVNIQITCPRCDYFKECPWKGRFTTAIHEAALYNKSSRVSCPYKRRTIYLDKVGYFVVDPPVYEKQDTDIHIDKGTPPKARGKYAQKARSEVMDKIREGQRRRYKKKR